MYVKYADTYSVYTKVFSVVNIFRKKTPMFINMVFTGNYNFCLQLQRIVCNYLWSNGEFRANDNFGYLLQLHLLLYVVWFNLFTMHSLVVSVLYSALWKMDKSFIIISIIFIILRELTIPSHFSFAYYACCQKHKNKN